MAASDASSCSRALLATARAERTLDTAHLTRGSLIASPFLQQILFVKQWIIAPACDAT